MNRAGIPSLDDLRAFEAVARAGSVRAAAEELSLTHGAVSRRVSRLATDLGVALVARDGRGIRVTDSGARIAKAAADAFALISTAVREVRSAGVEGPVVLSCERSVAMRWLIPRLSRFQDSRPDIPVHLSVGGGALDLGRQGVALAIRRMDFPADPRWSVETLFAESVGPVMRRDQAARFHRGDYLGLGSRTRAGAWDVWLSRHRDAPRPREIRFFDHHFLMAEAAVNGMGVAMCPKVLALDDMLRDRFVAPLGFTPDGTVYALIALPHREDRGAEDAVRGWLLRTGAEVDGVPDDGRLPSAAAPA